MELEGCRFAEEIEKVHKVLHAVFTYTPEEIRAGEHVQDQQAGSRLYEEIWPIFERYTNGQVTQLLWYVLKLNAEDAVRQAAWIANEYHKRKPS